MRFITYTFFICISFSLFATENSSTQKIVFIGDSITEGYGVSHEQAFPALIQAKATKADKKWMIINSGISGSTSASAAARVRWALKEKPLMIVLALGANDGLRGLKVEAMRKNLEEAIELCKKASVKVMLAGMQMPPNYGEKYVRDFAAAFPALATKEKIPLIPFLLKDVAGIKDLNQADQIHPNEKGHVIIAETVYQALRQELK